MDVLGILLLVLLVFNYWIIGGVCWLFILRWVYLLWFGGRCLCFDLLIWFGLLIVVC